MSKEYKIIDFELGKFKITAKTEVKKLEKIVNKRVNKANKRKMPN